MNYPDRRLRVLHVMYTARAEGTPRLVLDWLPLKELDQGCLFLSSQAADIRDDFVKTGCWIRFVDAILTGPIKILKIIGESRRAVRDFRPDVVIVWPLGFSHWVFLGARLAGSHAGLLSHGGNPPGKGFVSRYLMTWICLWITALCDGKMVACSKYVQRLYQEIPFVPNASVVMIYNAVRSAELARRAELSRATRAALSPFRAIMVATLEKHKDQPTLIRAARILKLRNQKIEILLVGGGSRESELKTLVREMNLDDIVQFLGPRRDVPELLGKSDLFVLSTTNQEGQPVVILEAMSAGLPIIATDVEPLREVLRDGRWGSLVPFQNPEALADAISKSLALGRRSPTTATRDYLANFTVERMGKNYIECALSGVAKGMLV